MFYAYLMEHFIVTVTALHIHTQRSVRLIIERSCVKNTRMRSLDKPWQGFVALVRSVARALDVRFSVAAGITIP
jgi:hypothetical protein